MEAQCKPGPASAREEEGKAKSASATSGAKNTSGSEPASDIPTSHAKKVLNPMGATAAASPTGPANTEAAATGPVKASATGGTIGKKEVKASATGGTIGKKEVKVSATGGASSEGSPTDVSRGKNLRGSAQGVLQAGPSVLQAGPSGQESSSKESNPGATGGPVAIVEKVNDGRKTPLMVNQGRV